MIMTFWFAGTSTSKSASADCTTSQTYFSSFVARNAPSLWSSSLSLRRLAAAQKRCQPRSVHWRTLDGLDSFQCPARSRWFTMEVMSELVMKQSVVQDLARIQPSIEKMGSRRLDCSVQFFCLGRIKHQNRSGNVAQNEQSCRRHSATPWFLEVSITGV